MTVEATRDPMRKTLVGLVAMAYKIGKHRKIIKTLTFSIYRKCHRGETGVLSS